MGDERSASAPGMGSAGVDFGVAAGCDPGKLIVGGGVGALLGIAIAAMALLFSFICLLYRRSFGGASVSRNCSI